MSAQCCNCLRVDSVEFLILFSTPRGSACYNFKLAHLRAMVAHRATSMALFHYLNETSKIVIEERTLWNNLQSGQQRNMSLRLLHCANWSFRRLALFNIFLKPPTHVYVLTEILRTNEYWELYSVIKSKFVYTRQF